MIVHISLEEKKKIKSLQDEWALNSLVSMKVKLMSYSKVWAISESLLPK